MARIDWEYHNAYKLKDHALHMIEVDANKCGWEAKEVFIGDEKENQFYVLVTDKNEPFFGDPCEKEKCNYREQKNGECHCINEKLENQPRHPEYG